MTALPVAHRELRVAARLPRGHVVRVLAALVALALIAYGLTLAQAASLFDNGRTLFRSLLALGFMVVLLGAPGVTADAVSRERREGTLGFLFLSHLSAFDIVLGKLLAQGTHALFGLMAAVPMLAIPLVMGGVTFSEFVFEILALINLLLICLCAGLAVSPLCLNPRQAKGAAVTVILLLVFGPQIAAWAFESVRGTDWIVTMLRWLSPETPFAAAMVPAGGTANRPWTALTIGPLQALGLLWLGARLTRRAWRERPAGILQLRWRDCWQRFALGPTAARATRRRAMLDRNAFFWFIARWRFKPLAPAVLTIAAAALALWAVLVHAEPVSVAIWLGTLLILKFWIVSEAVAPIAAHLRDGTLELLLATPLTVRDIMRGQFLALRRQFLVPVIICTIVPPVVVIGLLLGPRDTDEVLSVFWFATAVSLGFLADAVTLVWVGTWKAISSRRLRHAAGNAASLVLIAPWLFLMLLLPAAAGSGSGVAVMVVMWLVVGLFTDGLFLGLARDALYSRFRTEAERVTGAAQAGWLDRLMDGKAP